MGDPWYVPDPALAAIGEPCTIATLLVRLALRSSNSDPALSPADPDPELASPEPLKAYSM